MSDLELRRKKYFKQLKEHRPKVVVLSEFKNQKSILKYRCECGAMNKTTAQSLLQSKNCRHCHKYKITKYRFDGKIHKAKSLGDAIKQIARITYFSEGAVTTWFKNKNWERFEKDGIKIIRVGDVYVR